MVGWGWGSCLSQGRSPRVLLHYSPPFSLTLNSEMGNKVWDKEVNYKVTRGTVLGGSVLHRALLLLGLVVSTLI